MDNEWKKIGEHTIPVEDTLPIATYNSTRQAFNVFYPAAIICPQCGELGATVLITNRPLEVVGEKEEQRND